MTVENADVISEMRSIVRYLTWAFPEKEIWYERPPEAIEADIRVDFVQPAFNLHGNYATWVDHPVVIYYNSNKYDDVARHLEKFREVFFTGLEKFDDPVLVKGYKLRIPFWIWPQDDNDPRPEVKDFKGYLRARDFSVRIIEQEEPGKYTLAAELTVQGYRVDYDDSGQPTISYLQIN